MLWSWMGCWSITTMCSTAAKRARQVLREWLPASPHEAGQSPPLLLGTNMPGPIVLYNHEEIKGLCPHLWKDCIKAKSKKKYLLGSQHQVTNIPPFWKCDSECWMLVILRLFVKWIYVQPGLFGLSWPVDRLHCKAGSNTITILMN